MDKTIQQGDAFAVVCGVKEPKGRVRCLGLGPTPQDIGTPGLKAYTSTRLQIQVLARQKAESDNLVLQQRILEMQQREEERMARESPIVERISQHGSNSRQQMVSYFSMPFHSMVLVYKYKFSPYTNLIFDLPMLDVEPKI
jgi:hypothetical protein